MPAQNGAIQEQNKKAMQEIYSAFGRGDMSAIFDLLDPDIQWGLQ